MNRSAKNIKQPVSVSGQYEAYSYPGVDLWVEATAAVEVDVIVYATVSRSEPVTLRIPAHATRSERIYLRDYSAGRMEIERLDPASSTTQEFWGEGNLTEW